MLHPRMRLEAIRTQPHIQMHHILYYLLQAIAGLAERKPPHLTNKVGKLESHGKPFFFCASSVVFCGPAHMDRTSSAMSQGSPALLLALLLLKNIGKHFAKQLGRVHRGGSIHSTSLKDSTCLYRCRAATCLSNYIRSALPYFLQGSFRRSLLRVNVMLIHLPTTFWIDTGQSNCQTSLAPSPIMALPPIDSAPFVGHWERQQFASGIGCWSCYWKRAET